MLQSYGFVTQVTELGNCDSGYKDIEKPLTPTEYKPVLLLLYTFLLRTFILTLPFNLKTNPLTPYELYRCHRCSSPRMALELNNPQKLICR